MCSDASSITRCIYIWSFLVGCLQVVTLQQSEWRRLKTKQQQVEYAWQLSQGVQVSAPGMPHLVHQVVLDNPKDDPRKKKSLPQVLLRILLEGH
jgi:hypothetical protein